jgi:anti-sigma regulatory factor (Ser/Thr protein kinase)
MTKQAREERSFRVHPSSLADVRRWLRGIGEERSVGSELTQELVIAVNEACTNAVLHSRGDRIGLTWSEDPDIVEVEIRDGGMFRGIKLAGAWEERGRGLPVMLAAADELAIVKGSKAYPGTSVRIRKRKRRPSVEEPADAASSVGNG